MRPQACKAVVFGATASSYGEQALSSSARGRTTGGEKLRIGASAVELGAFKGEGSYGKVFEGIRCGVPVAVKVFKESRPRAMGSANGRAIQASKVKYVRT